MTQIRRLMLAPGIVLVLAGCGSAGITQPTDYSTAGVRAAGTRLFHDVTARDSAALRREMTADATSYGMPYGWTAPSIPALTADAFAKAKIKIEHKWAYVRFANKSGQTVGWMRFVYQRGRWLFNDSLGGGIS
jgi:hypothetical protein